MKMKKNIFFLLFLFISVLGFGANNLDSIKTIYVSDVDQRDTFVFLDKDYQKDKHIFYYNYGSSLRTPEITIKGVLGKNLFVKEEKLDIPKKEEFSDDPYFDYLSLLKFIQGDYIYELSYFEGSYEIAQLTVYHKENVVFNKNISEYQIKNTIQSILEESKKNGNLGWDTQSETN